MTVVFRLPFPPSVNNLFAGTRRRYPSRRYRAWRRAAEVELLRQHGRQPRIRHRVAIDIELTPPDRRARDAGNYEKAATDLLVAMGILADDSSRHVSEVRTRWSDRSGPPQALVTLRPA